MMNHIPRRREEKIEDLVFLRRRLAGMGRTSVKLVAGPTYARGSRRIQTPIFRNYPPSYVFGLQLSNIQIESVEKVVGTYSLSTICSG